MTSFQSHGINDSIIRSTKRMCAVLCAGGLLLALHAGPARAATGDNLASFDAVVTAGIPSCSVGTGIAYDGTNLLLSCWGSNVLERVNATTHLNGGAVTIAGVSDLRAMAWDATRGRLWACNGSSTVVLIDTGTGTVDASVPSFGTDGCVDGLAYDGSDDTIWSSDDVASSIQHYTTAGVLIASFPLGGLLGGCGNSGIAVGGSNLYLANNGCSQIYTLDKAVTSSTLFASFPARLEDLECDGRTFAGQNKGAIWSLDAYDRTLNAWEIAPGLCAFGGLGSCPDGKVDPGEQCDDGNTVSGDDCDANCQLEARACPGDCGDPALAFGKITAVDSLYILRTAVDLQKCPLCVCDLDNSGTILANDALADLRSAVGLPQVLSCPSVDVPTTTTTLAPPTTTTTLPDTTTTTTLAPATTTTLPPCVGFSSQC